MKDINIEDRLIFALDVPEVDQAKALVDQLDDSVNFYKIGMELLMTGQYFELMDWLLAKDKKVFVILNSLMFQKLLVELLLDSVNMVQLLPPFTATKH
jgi:hypothetical protein